jgi:DnaJ-class molecular chaperone
MSVDAWNRLDLTMTQLKCLIVLGAAGKASLEWLAAELVPRSRGDSRMRQVEEKGMDEELTWRDCPNCDGEGRIVDCRPGSGGGEECPHCSGGGKQCLKSMEKREDR